jgi:putative flavoprotein involved in K+ transport
MLVTGPNSLSAQALGYDELMKERHDTVIIGGGQAGLALSYHLRAQSREHIILERRSVAERWRCERWDSLYFQFPNWALELPGYPYQGNDPNGFASHKEVTRFIDEYARFIDAPVRCGADVVVVERESTSARFVVATRDTKFEASRVVLATGPFQRPSLPAPSPMLPPGILQLHASQYFNPDQLPTGAVLIVGAGSSGCQIAEELYRCGRTVYLSVSRHRRAPRRYRGRDSLWWLLGMGLFDTAIDSLPGRKIPPPLVVTGVDGGHDINVRQFAAEGVVLLGKFFGVADGTLLFAEDLEENLAYADAAAAEFTRSVDHYAHALESQTVEANSLDSMSAVAPARLTSMPTLNLTSAGIRSVIWCTGYRFDFGWVRLPIFNEHGAPLQQRGVTSCPGAYFLGLHWMHTFKSGTFLGVGADAAYIAEHMATSE